MLLSIGRLNLAWMICNKIKKLIFFKDLFKNNLTCNENSIIFAVLIGWLFYKFELNALGTVIHLLLKGIPLIVVYMLISSPSHASIRFSFKLPCTSS